MLVIVGLVIARLARPGVRIVVHTENPIVVCFQRGRFSRAIRLTRQGRRLRWLDDARLSWRFDIHDFHMVARRRVAIMMVVRVLRINKA